MKFILKDPQFDVILSNFPSSKDYSLLLTGIVLRGPSSHEITHNLFSNHCLFLSLLKFKFLYDKPIVLGLFRVCHRPRPYRSYALRRLMI